VQVDHLADGDRTTEMRRQQCHALPYAVVCGAVTVVPHDRNAGIACRRLVESYLHGVDVALGCGPLLVELRLAVFFERDEIQECRDVTDLRLDGGRDNRRIDRSISLYVGLGVFGIVVPGEIEVRGLLRDIVGVQCRCDANDKIARLLQCADPQVRIECGIVDVADQARNTSCVHLEGLRPQGRGLTAHSIS
jgi:hypothetical protein